MALNPFTYPLHKAIQSYRHRQPLCTRPAAKPNHEAHSLVPNWILSQSSSFGLPLHLGFWSTPSSPDRSSFPHFTLLQVVVISSSVRIGILLPKQSDQFGISNSTFLSASGRIGVIFLQRFGSESTPPGFMENSSGSVLLPKQSDRVGSLKLLHRVGSEF